MRSTVTSRLIPRRFFFVLLLSWCVGMGAFLGVILLCVRHGAKFLEQCLLSRTAGAVAQELVLHESDPRQPEAELRFLQAVNPDIQAYVLDREGKVTASVEASTLGFHVPLSIPHALQTPAVMLETICGADPLQNSPCVPVAAAPLTYRGESGYLYITATNGFSSALAWPFSLSVVPRSFFIQTAFTLACVLTVWGYFAMLLRVSFSAASDTLERFLKGDYQQRIAIDSSDELSLMADALNSMADTVSAEEKELRDVAEQRKQVLAGVLHDLLRPVSSMRLLLERYRRDGTGITGERQEALRSVIRTDRGVLEELRQVKEPAPSASTNDSSEYVLAEIVQEVFGALRAKQAELSQQCIFEAEPGLPRGIGNRDAVLRVLLNLVDNACAYSPPGGLIRVRAFPIDGLIGVEVIDHGMGIPQSELPRIFQPFYRSAQARAMSPGGSGLGLAAVKRIIVSLGGAIQIRPSMPHGTTVRCIFPSVDNRFVPHMPVYAEWTNPSLPAFPSLLRVDVPGHNTIIGVALLSMTMLLLCPVSPDVSRTEAFRWFGLLTVVCGAVYLSARIVFYGQRDAALTSNARAKHAETIRCAVLATFGLVWSMGLPVFVGASRTISAVVFLIGLAAGFGMTLSLRPRWKEFAAAALPLGLPLVATLLRRNNTVEWMSCLFAMTVTTVISLQVRRRRSRFLSRRLAAFLYGLVCASLALQAFVTGFDLLRQMARARPADRPPVLETVREALSREETNGTPPSRETLQNRLGTMGFYNPRLDLSLLCEGAPCGNSPWVSREEAPSASYGHKMLPPIYARGSESSAHVTSIVINESPRRELVVAESNLAQFVVQRGGQKYLFWMVLAALFVSGGISSSAVVFGVRDLRRRLTLLNREIRGFASDPAAPEWEHWPRDEVFQLHLVAQRLMTRVRLTRENLVTENEHTVEIIAHTCDALMQLSHRQESILDGAGADSEQTLERLRSSNTLRADLIDEVFDCAVLVSGGRGSVSVSLLEAVDEASLLFAANAPSGPPPAILNRVEPDLGVVGDAELLARALASLFVRMGPCGNAIEVSATRKPDGSISLELRATRSQTASVESHTDLRTLLSRETFRYYQCRISSGVRNETQQWISVEFPNSAAATAHTPHPENMDGAPPCTAE